jgi:CRP/FNR family transcriptional regulator, cyclic AMP receptor protein
MSTDQLTDLNHHVDKLRESEIFKNIALEDLQALLKVMEPRDFPAGTLLFERGDDGDSMVEIIAGKIRIFTTDSEGNDLTLVVRGAGEVVGELTLLDRQPRSASAIATEDTRVLVLHRDNFLEFLKERPSVGLQLMLTLSGRIRYTTTYLQRVVDWLNHVREGDLEQALVAIQDSASSDADDADMQRLIQSFMGILNQMQQHDG